MFKRCAARGTASNTVIQQMQQVRHIAGRPRTGAGLGPSSNLVAHSAMHTPQSVHGTAVGAHQTTAASWPWDDWGSVDYWMDWAVEPQEERAIAEGVLVRDAWDGSIQDIQLEVTNLGMQTNQQWTAEQELQAMESAVSGSWETRGCRRQACAF